ncbi:hypothetical protein TorRG33x02_161080 [Trema orientale]|uniref:Uncharacterized protein n=1 Tax=Trema orientale TaxID=63057 RepID=A0A2P5ERE0_TREOI|nr:hypothetical protein TorRG33x02_161080 [Trema orientale]
MEAAVDSAKSRRQTEEVLPDLETVFCGSVILNKGAGQQLWRHTREASFSLGECILFFSSFFCCFSFLSSQPQKTDVLIFIYILNIKYPHLSASALFAVNHSVGHSALSFRF